MHTGADFELRQRKRPTARTAQSQPIRAFFGSDEVKVFPIPSIAAAYNDEMGGVDRGDQRRAGKGYDHHICRGGWQALAWTFLLETLLVNSFILQAQGDPSWSPSRSQVSWRQCLFDAIVNTYAATGSSRERFRAGDITTPVSQHKYVRRKNPSACFACKGLRFYDARSKSSEAALRPQSVNRQVRRSRYFCETCNVALCNSQNCWDFYHGLK